MAVQGGATISTPWTSVDTLALTSMSECDEITTGGVQRLAIYSVTFLAKRMFLGILSPRRFGRRRQGAISCMRMNVSQLD